MSPPPSLCRAAPPIGSRSSGNSAPRASPTSSISITPRKPRSSPGSPAHPTAMRSTLRTFAVTSRDFTPTPPSSTRSPIAPNTSPRPISRCSPPPASRSRAVKSALCPAPPTSLPSPRCSGHNRKSSYRPQRQDSIQNRKLGKSSSTPAAAVLTASGPPRILPPSATVSKTT